MIKETKSFELSNSGIDQASDSYWEWISKIKVQKKSAMRSRFALEEVLINILKNCPDAKEFCIRFGFRFGKPIIIVVYNGKEYDPLDNGNTDESSVLSHLMQKMDYAPSYAYRHGQNEIFFNIEKRHISTEVYLTAAVILAIVSGLLGRFIPLEIKEGVSYFALGFVSDAFQNMLSTFSGLMIFIILIGGICSLGSVSNFSKIGKTVIGRYLGLTLLGGALLTAFAIPFFKLQWGGMVQQSDLPNQIYDIIINIIPSNPIAPFYNGDMLQIVFLAIFVGIVMLALEGRVEGVKKLVNKMDILITKAINVVCIILPLFMFASLLSMFWNVGFSVILSFWKPVVLGIILGAILPVGKLLYVSIRFKVSPLLILKKVSKSLIMASMTASSVAAFQITREDTVKKLGIKDKIFDLSYPIGMQLYNPCYMLIYLLIVLVMAETYNIPISAIWIILAYVYSVVFATATPCVSGGTLICIGIMMSNLSIPNEALALGGTLSVILDFILTGEELLLDELELLLQAKKFDLVDEAVLRSKV